MESVEDRILLSAAVQNPLAAVTESSSPAAASLAAVSSYMVSTLEQWLITLEQGMSNAVTMLSHDIAQVEAYFVKEVDQFLGIPTTPNPAAGSSGRGSGSGASLTGHGNNPTTGGSKIEPMAGSGSATVSFGQSPIYTVEPSMCGSVTVTIPVYAKNNANTSVSVNYSTQDGSATAGTDYTTESGTLNFAPGQTTPEYTKPIPILDDGTDETPPNGYDTFSVNLSGAQNATIVQPNPAYVNIDEGPQQKPTDTLRWNPCGGNLASTVTNWYDVTQSFQLQKGALGPNPYSPIQFDAYPGDTPYSNADITWDKSYTVASISFTEYTGEQTLDDGDSLEVLGVNGTAVNESPNSFPTIKLGKNDHLTTDADSDWTSFNIISKTPGDLTPQWVVKAGTTKLAYPSGCTENLGVNLIVNGGARIAYESYNTLNLTASNLVITVQGEMDLYYGTGNGITLIQAGNQVSGCYIDVTDGKLVYDGETGVEDTLAIPVLVENNGNFTVAGYNQAGGGWLKVTGQVAKTMKYSVYMTSGSVNLSNATTLECDDDYQQTNGTLQTTDASYCALQDGPTGALGTAVINGGSLVINGGLGSGTFGVDANNLNFNGGLTVGIQGNQTGVNGQLKVSGNMNNQANSALAVKLNGALANGMWTIIDTGGANIAQFGLPLNVPPGTTPKPNNPNPGDYQITSP